MWAERNKWSEIIANNRNNQIHTYLIPAYCKKKCFMLKSLEPVVTSFFKYYGTLCVGYECHWFIKFFEMNVWKSCKASLCQALGHFLVQVLQILFCMRECQILFIIWWKTQTKNDVFQHEIHYYKGSASQAFCVWFMWCNVKFYYMCN